jgi:hypothetical protein
VTSPVLAHERVRLVEEAPHHAKFRGAVGRQHAVHPDPERAEERAADGAAASP